MTTATGTPVVPANREESKLPFEFLEPFKKPMIRDFALVLALIAINLFCYHRTLNGYFLADDFVHVPYLVKVFNGHADLLLQNFYSNWVQAQGTQFYRPFISLTLAFDYALWKANPLGYHISNFVYQVLACIFLFLTTRRLFHYSNQLEANSFAFLAGAFFAACPLHPEVVSWIIARVDSVQATFLLASFWLYLRARESTQSRVTRGLSLACYCIALMSKEMAITLPPTLFFFEIIKAPSGNFLDRLKEAGKRTWQYWIVFAIYMGIRTASLGTISGGYAGSIGEGLSSSLVKRWFQDGAFTKISFPLNNELGAAAHRAVKSLRTIYGIAAILFVARAILLYREGALKTYTKRLMFAAGWFVIAMLPTYQVFNLTDTLQGSRFIYLGTAPLCLLLSLLVAPIQFQSWCVYKRIINACSIVLTIVLLWTLMQLTYQNNLAWSQANKGVKEFRQAIENFFKNKSSETQLAIMNIPQRFAGAHMLYNAATLGVLLSPPLSKDDVSRRVVTFEPIEFGDAELLNASRLRRMLTNQNKLEIARWDSKAFKLVPLHLEPLVTNKVVAGSDNTDSRTEGNESYLASPSLDVPALSVDFVEVEFSSDKPVASTDVVVMSWNTGKDGTFKLDQSLSQALPKSKRIVFPVSEHKSWVLSELIHQLKFDLPNGLSIKKLTLKNGANVIPTLAPDLSVQSNDGRTVKEDVGGVSRPGKTIGPYAYDVSKVPGVDHAVFEISKADSWFEHYTGTYRDKSLSKEALLTKSVKPLSGRFQTPTHELTRPGFYEIRVAAVDKNGKLLGTPSDPIDLQFSAQDLKN